MSFLFAVFLLLAMSLCALLNLVTLPGNWAMAVLVVLWAMLVPGNTLTAGFFVLFFGLALLGEGMEFLMQIWGSQKYGSSPASTFAGIVGAILGALAGSPFLFGLGAVLGSLFGAWAGCYLTERFLRHQDSKAAFRAAQGAFVGKFFGMIVKFGIGVSLIALTASYIWPDAVPLRTVTL
ncbi:DUF456 domain-containing protein [uncultured Mailhella sp.]|uniref:DUF456 domain-containing protein n=1 Tax=uncultured Mailhella sp. TaxID=1981031 RepID=UPI0026022C1A|nr:DUF456 domain-containing protein [uncultured Mailhella sp.]